MVLDPEMLTFIEARERALARIGTKERTPGDDQTQAGSLRVGGWYLPPSTSHLAAYLGCYTPDTTVKPVLSKALIQAPFFSPSRGPVTLFEFFPFLPTELRYKIWSYAQPGPRRVDVRFFQDGRINTHKLVVDMPVLLSVCRESRAETLKKYTVAFRNPKAINGCYFDFEHDTLYVPQFCALNQLYHFVAGCTNPEDLAKVQRFAFDRPVFDYYVKFIGEPKAHEFIFSFSNLKEFIIVEDRHSIYCKCGRSNDDGFCDMTSPPISKLRVGPLIDYFNLHSQNRTLAPVSHSRPAKGFTEWRIPEFVQKECCPHLPAILRLSYKDLAPAHISHTA